MSTIKGLYKRVQTLNTSEVIKQTVDNKKDEYLAENQKQLFEGFDKNGKRLQKYRNNKYARVKNDMNPLPGLGNPDFRVTGAFYRGMSVRVEAGAIKTNLGDSKSDDLLKRDPDIIGLGGKYKEEFIGILRPALIKGFKEKLKL